VRSSVSHLHAIGLALVGFAFWVLTDTGVKLSGEAKIPVYEIVGILGLIQTLCLGLPAWQRGEIKKLWPRRPRPQLGRSFLGLTTMIFNAIALKHLPLTVFYVIVFMAPMMTAILAALILREHLNWQKTLAILCGFAGVIYAINPGASMRSGDWIGYASAAIGTTAFAANMVWLRVMTRTESVQSLAFFSGFIYVAACLIPTVLHFAAPTKLFIGILILTGVFNMFGNLCHYKALKHTTAANVSQFHYTQIVMGALIGYAIWRDVPHLHLILGAVMIVGSGLYIAAHARRMENRAAVSPR